MPRSANSETPYLSHLRTHHGQVTLVPPESSARARKPSTGRSGRNPAVYGPPPPRGRRGATQVPPVGQPSLHPQLDVDMPIPDFPPPSFQEAITTPVYRMQEIAMSDASFSSYYSIQRSPSVDSYPTTSASSPASQYEDAHDADAVDIGHPLPVFLTSDTGSPVGQFPAEWEVERQQGIPLEERVRRERERREQAETTHLSAGPPKSPPHSRIRSCSHCGASSNKKSPTDDRRARPAETGPRRRGFLRHRHSQSFPSASVPSTPIRSRPRTSLKSTSSSKRKSRSMSPRPSLMTPMSTSNSLSLMSRKLFAHSHKGKDKSTEDEPLESWEVLDTGSLPDPRVEVPQPPVSRVRRTLSRMSLSALTAINTQTEAGRNGSIEPYHFELPLPSATAEKSRLKHSDPPATTHNMPSSLQRDYPLTTTSTPPPVRANSPLTTKSFSPSNVPPTPSMNMAASTPDLNPARPVTLVDSRQSQTSPLISPVAMRLGVRQRVKSMSVHTGPPSSIVFPKVPIPADRRATPNSNLRKHTSTTINPSSPLSVLNAFPDVPPIKTHFEKPTQNRDSHVSSLSTIRPPPSPLVSPLEPPTPVRHHYPGRPLPTPPAGVPPSPSAYESLLLPRSATTPRFPLTLNVPNWMSGTMMTERSIATSSGLTYLTDRPISPLSSASGSSITEAISEADDETLGSEVTDLDILVPRINPSDGSTYQ
ncbi:hypothetical protein BDM02DRAFT_2257157 [Thelephora ganbajun]|uniref:Uncharacterized protein n=1 Tax=Thelephora ganbajun TaxID=370292 RepID=A0ACB6ZFP4_THEGA|nr:hypothetical protein BDM02DRAFT_2257157 [Thelephora ganbajun]